MERWSLRFQATHNTMSFDISWIEIDGSIGTSVSLNLDEHYALFGQMLETQYKVLIRLRDYYRDADFTLQELPTLKRELEVRMEEIESLSLREKLKFILILVEEAISRKKTIAAIAD